MTTPEKKEGLFKTAWEVLFKINQVLIPLFLGWAIWVTGNIFETRAYMAQRPVTTAKDMSILEKDIKTWASQNFASLQISNDIKQIQSDINDLKTGFAVLNYQLIDDKKTNKDIKNRH